MNKNPHTPELAPLPTELHDQLQKFQKHLWRIKITEALLAGLAGLIFSFLLVFLLDRLFPTPPLIRLLIFLGGASLFAIFAPLMVHKWVFKHRREEQLARLISKKFPKLGDRLLGVIELQDQDETRESLSPELRKAAMTYVAAQASKRNMDDALPLSRQKKLAAVLLLGAGTAVAAFILNPNAGVNSLKRWLMPLSDTERYTLTQIDHSHIGKPHHVPYGEEFSIHFLLKESSDDRPQKATVQYGTQKPIETTLSESGEYTFTLPGQQAKDILTLKAGDAIHRFRIQPTIRPELSNLNANITLPDYLQIPPSKIEATHGTISVLEGSQISLSGSTTSSRHLASGTFTATPSVPESVEAHTEDSFLEENDYRHKSPPPKPITAELNIDKDTFTTPPLTLTTYDLDIPITWTDTHGLKAASPFKLRIESVSDQAPFIYTQGIEKQIVLLPEETITFQLNAEDDFGIKEMGLIWNGEFTKPTDQQPASGEMIIKKGSPTELQLNEETVFSPKTHDISPQKLTLQAYVIDYKPERKRTLSEPITLYILTLDEHAQLLKNQFDKIIGNLEDIARQEQNNLDQNQRLEQQNDGQQLQEEENRQKLAEQELAEQDNTEKLEELAKEMEELFQDSLRNENVDKDTLKKMSESLQDMKGLAQKDLPEVQEKLQESQNRKSTPEKTEEDLKDAIEKQKEAIEKMKETIKEANDANEDLEAATFVNRLKRAASEQNSIASSIISELTQAPKENIPPLVGKAISDSTLDPTHRRFIDGLSALQKRTASDVSWIQEDLGHYYARTQKEIHKEIMTDMRDSGIDPALLAIRTRIEANHTFKTIPIAQKWSEQLNLWAKKLDKALKEENDGGGEGGGNPPGGESDFEFMLKVMRMVQQEQGLRSRTRSLEQLKRSNNLKQN